MSQLQMIKCRGTSRRHFIICRRYNNGGINFMEDSALCCQKRKIVVRIFHCWLLLFQKCFSLDILVSKCHFNNVFENKKMIAKMLRKLTHERQ